MKRPKIAFILISVLAMSTKCLPQKFKLVDGEFACKEDTRVKLIIKNGRFAYIDAAKEGELATPCCDTLTYGDVSLDRGGFLLLKSDPSLNPIFVSMNVIERKNDATDSIEFIIHNPIEEIFRKNNSQGGDLIYSFDVDPYFKENMQSFEGNRVRFYNPQKTSIYNFSILIQPKCSIDVKNLVVREMYTDTYTVKTKGANVFEINIPKLSYGFISYLRLEGDYAKMVGRDTIVWKGKEFIRKE